MKSLCRTPLSLIICVSELLLYKIVLFGVGDPNWLMRNVTRRTVSKRRRAWNIGWYSMQLELGCSRHQNTPFAEANNINMIALEASTLPFDTASLSLRPSGFVLDLIVLPIDLGVVEEPPTFCMIMFCSGSPNHYYWNIYFDWVDSRKLEKHVIKTSYTITKVLHTGPKGPQIQAWDWACDIERWQILAGKVDPLSCHWSSRRRERRCGLPGDAYVFFSKYNHWGSLFEQPWNSPSCWIFKQLSNDPFHWRTEFEHVLATLSIHSCFVTSMHPAKLSKCSMGLSHCRWGMLKTMLTNVARTLYTGFAVWWGKKGILLQTI